MRANDAPPLAFKLQPSGGRVRGRLLNTGGSPGRLATIPFVADRCRVG